MKRLGMQAGSGDAVEYYFNYKDVHHLFMLCLFTDERMCYFACLGSRGIGGAEGQRE